MTRDRRIYIKNIYYMLAYAFHVLKQKNYDRVAAESFEHEEDLMAAILSIGVAQQVKQGLYREYVSQKEDLTRSGERSRFRKHCRIVCSIRKRSAVNTRNFRRIIFATRS